LADPSCENGKFGYGAKCNLLYITNTQYACFTPQLQLASAWAAYLYKNSDNRRIILLPLSQRNQEYRLQMVYRQQLVTRLSDSLV
jgi:hypothetical protein